MLLVELLLLLLHNDAKIFGERCQMLLVALAIHELRHLLNYVGAHLKGGGRLDSRHRGRRSPRRRLVSRRGRCSVLWLSAGMFLRRISEGLRLGLDCSVLGGWVWRRHICGDGRCR